MIEFKCPICGKPPILEEFGADWEYCYQIGQCKNGHRFGIKWKGTEEELGRGREIVFRNRARKLFLKRIQTWFRFKVIKKEEK